MIIKISNFGPVRSFEIDLEKDFHLFVGKNNIGKSYAITAVYLIVKSFSEISPNNISIGMNPFFIDDFFEDDGTAESVDKILEIGKGLKPRQECNIKEIVVGDVKKSFEGIICQSLKNSFSNTFSSLENLYNRYSGENPVISISHGYISFDISIFENRVEISKVDIDKEFVVKMIKQNRDINDSGSKCTIYICKNREREFGSSYKELVTIRHVFGFIYSFTRVIDSVHYLPASRSGLYQALSAFGQIIAELSKNRSFLSKKIELPGISEPVSDYFLKLSDIRVQKKTFEDKEINKIAKEIEEKILKGRVEFNSQTKQLMFYPRETNLKLELSSTSSMVSELAPIVSYLRYVLTTNIRKFRRKSNYNVRQPSHLIMIEEPEAHLHPEIQIELTEIFSKLIGANVKLIITSHSNYIFNKVNNLIMSGNLEADQVNSGVFKSSAKGSVLLQLGVNDLGVEDDNFSEATSALFEEKMDIISRINEEGFSDD